MTSCALALAQAQIAVFPCAPGSTRPLGVRGPGGATHDLDQVWAWWQATPHANVAMPTGPGGFDVLDVDSVPDGNGFASFRTLKEAGLLEGWAMKVATPNGGLHFYFPARPDGQPDTSMPHAGIDFRGAGGWIVVPPSRLDRPDGSTIGYEVLEQRTTGMAYLDLAAIKAALPPPPTAGPVDSRVAAIIGKVSEAGPQDRDGLLQWATRKHVELGVTDLSALVNAATHAGIDTRTINRIITATTHPDQGSTRVAAGPATTPAAPTPALNEVTGP